MKKEDIILNKGDKVHFTYTLPGGTKDFLIINDYGCTAKEFEADGCKITKIERLETIYEAPKEILDKEEKEWLSTVIKPFKDRFLYLIKLETLSKEFGWLVITLKDTDIQKQTEIQFPLYENNKMYKGMEVDKEYTLEELGLFQGEKDE